MPRKPQSEAASQAELAGVIITRMGYRASSSPDITANNCRAPDVIVCAANGEVHAVVSCRTSRDVDMAAVRSALIAGGITLLAGEALTVALPPEEDRMNRIAVKMPAADRRDR